MQLKITHLKNKLAGLIALSFAAVIVLSNAAGTVSASRGGRTGASFDTSSCSGCHSGATFAGASVTVQLLSGSTPVTTYIPGSNYTVQVKVVRTGISTAGYYYGYQVVGVKASDNSDVAGWGTPPAGSHSAVWNARTYVEQSATIHALAAASINIPWTAPASGTGNVVFYAAGCLVNHDLLPTGDEGVTTNLTVSESAGCVTATLNTTDTAVTCYGYTNGSIGLTATGGTGAIGFSWTGPAGYTATTENISGIAAGTYTVVVTSLGGCKDTTTATVSTPPQLTGTVAADTPICPGGTLTFTTIATGGTGGSGSYTYSWSGPNTFSSAIADPSVTGFNALDSGVYSLTIMDVLSCTYTTTIDIGMAPAPVFSLGPDTALCPPGTIVLGVSLTGDTYLWNTAVTTPTITVTDSGYYSVTITNSYNCSASDTVHVGYNCPTSVENIIAGNDISIYPNPASDFISIHSTGNHNPQHISICNAYGQKVYDRHFDLLLNQHEIDIRHWAAGIYSVTIENDLGQEIKKLVITR